MVRQKTETCDRVRSTGCEINQQDPTLTASSTKRDVIGPRYVAQLTGFRVDHSKAPVGCLHLMFLAVNTASLGALATSIKTRAQSGHTLPQADGTTGIAADSTYAARAKECPG